MEDDFGMDQSGLRRAQLFGGKAVSFQITRALVSEEDVSPTSGAARRCCRTHQSLQRVVRGDLGVGVQYPQ